MKKELLIVGVTLLFPLFVSQATGGTALKINNVEFENSSQTITAHGINFTYFGPLTFTLGDADLTDNCDVLSDTEIVCSLDGHPAANGGSWTFAISAGNSPNTNEEIDIYIPVPLVAQECYPGDSVECYPGDQSTKNVGVCHSGTRFCQDDRTWGECTGYVAPGEEDPSNGFDDDCDGVVDEYDCLADGASCDDGNACTNNDVCTNGICSGEPISCDDGIACTSDGCVDGACYHEILGGACLIDGVCYFDQQTNSSDECLICKPTTDNNNWTNRCTSCFNDYDCPDGYYCDGSCHPKLSGGEHCASDNQCLSGSCSFLNLCN